MSQLGQDQFVLNNSSGPGFFVEFGVADGVTLSNTLLLEELGWTGIVCEPAVSYKVKRNCIVDRSCVWSTTGEVVEFNECLDPFLSTIHRFSGCDMHDRSQGIRYFVKTISLQDLLDKYQAPPVIDYLSIDTEGSEYEILNAFFPSRYKIRIITCEHNFQGNKQLVFDLLTRNGYTRVKEVEFEDWYVLNANTTN